MRIRGSSSAQQQAQKSLAVDSLQPGNTSRKGTIEFMGGWLPPLFGARRGRVLAWVGAGKVG